MYTVAKRKILTIITALLAALAILLGVSSINFAMAEINPVASSYFTYVSEGNHTAISISFENDNVVIPLSGSEDVKTKKNIVIDDFCVEMEVPLFDSESGSPKGIEFAFKIDADSYEEYGWYDADSEKFVETADNVIKFTATSSDKITVNFNGVDTEVTPDSENKNFIVLELNENDNFFDAKVNGQDLVANKIEKYKFAKYDKFYSQIHFMNSGSEYFDLTLISVDTHYEDASGAYKQTFAYDSADGQFVSYARPRFTMNKTLYNGGTFLLGRENAFSFSSHALLGNTVSSDVYVKANEADAIIGGSTNTLVKFIKEGNVVFNVTANYDCNGESGNTDETNYETYTVFVMAEDTAAPFYNASDEEIANYQKAVNEAVWSDKAAGYYITLGSDKTLKLPSMRNLVCDDTTSYDNLKYTVYYKTPSGESSKTSEFSIPVASEGKYVFYVVFKDESGNTMKTYDFMKTDANDTNKYEYGMYKKYIFEFEVFDNQPLEIKANEQSDGFIGIQYTAAEFDITASNYDTAYKLYYSETEIAEDADGWKEIVKKDSATDNNATYGEFTYDEIIEFAFNGTRNFTPTQKGYYKLTCTISSKASVRDAEASSIIKVEKEPVRVSNTDFFADNVGSVVFLALGTLCLIGMVVLLCIKPKDVNAEKKKRSK